MERRLGPSLLAVAGLALALLDCGGNPQRGEVERLRQENEELRSRIEALERGRSLARGQPQVAEEVLALFSKDSQQGTLAGLLPGDELPQARFRFGPEKQMRSWSSEGRPIFQYEWELEGGLFIRVNADEQGRLERIAVVLADPQSVDIATLAGLHLGQETYASLKRKFGDSLTTYLQIWGARGYYTVAQQTPLPPETSTFARSRRLGLEFAYEMPEGVSPVELKRIGEEVTRRNNSTALDPYLGERAPFSIALFKRP